MAERDLGYGFKYPPNRFETLLRRGRAFMLPTGDVSCGSPESRIDGEGLIVSPTGIQLVRNGLLLGRLLDQSRDPVFFENPLHHGYNGDVVRANIADRLGRQTLDVAVKKINKGISYFREIDTTGVEQFTALRALEDMGINCATPLIATRNRLITVWTDKPMADYQLDKELDKFFTELEKIRAKLISSGKWDSEWIIDYSPLNYAVNNLSSENPLDWFTVIDPMGISF